MNLDIMSSTQNHTMPGTQHNFLSNIDPDINLINVNSQNHCKYYNITDFNSETAKLEDNYISILATNLRSSNKNLHQFINYINNLNTNWTFIKITETWGKPHTITHFNILGYSHVYDIRTDKIGGGCSLYIIEKVSFKIRKDHLENLFLLK